MFFCKLPNWHTACLVRNKYLFLALLNTFQPRWKGIKRKTQMKNKFFKGLVASFALAVSGLANAGLIPYGVQEDVDINTVTDVWGWDLIYRDNYSVSNVSFSDLFDGHGDYIMLGAIRDGSSTIEVLAAVLWSDFMTHTAQNETNAFNGAEWYNNAGSFGFAGLGDAIQQGSADTSNVNANLRLSWHGQQGGYNTIANSMIYGWRAGEFTNLNDSTEWDKVVFTTNIAEVPEPSTLAVFALGLMGLASRKFKKQA